VNLRGEADGRQRPKRPGAGGSPTPAPGFPPQENRFPSPPGDPRPMPAQGDRMKAAESYRLGRSPAAAPAPSHGGGGGPAPAAAPRSPRGRRLCLPTPGRRAHREATAAANEVKFAAAPSFCLFRGASLFTGKLRAGKSQVAHPIPPLRLGHPWERGEPGGPLSPGSSPLGAGSAGARGCCAQCPPGRGREEPRPRLPGEQGEPPGPRNGPAFSPGGKDSDKRQPFPVTRSVYIHRDLIYMYT